MIVLIKEIVEYLLEKKDEGIDVDAELIDIVRLYLLNYLCHCCTSEDKQAAADMIIDIIRIIGCNPVMKPYPYSLYGCLAWSYNDQNKHEVERIFRSMKDIDGMQCMPNPDDILRHNEGEYKTILKRFAKNDMHI
jgi:hypothetical protein